MIAQSKTWPEPFDSAQDELRRRIENLKTYKANPLQLPLRQESEDRIIMNRPTAKQIGLTIPPNVLARADKVIR